MTVSLRILIKTEFSQAIMNSWVIQDQNEYNNKNQMKSLGR
jgi:hypothetical protein